MQLVKTSVPIEMLEASLCDALENPLFLLALNGGVLSGEIAKEIL